MSEGNGNKKENGSVFRVEKTKNYTVMSNFHLKDTKISLKAIGLLCKMLSLPENWDYSISGLVSICKESDTAVKSTLAELKEFGYLEINKLQAESGLFKYEYVVYEQPKNINSPEGGFPPLDNPPTDNPTVDEPTMENHIQLNTKELNTDLSNTQNQDNSSSNGEEPPLEIPVADQVQEFFNLYNLTVKRLPKAVKLTDKRRNKIKCRLKEISDMEEWKKIFERCDNSDFCAGLTGGTWQASLDFIIENQTNYTKIIEGRYDNKLFLRNNNNNHKSLEQLQQEGMDLL